MNLRHSKKPILRFKNFSDFNCPKRRWTKLNLRRNKFRGKVTCLHINYRSRTGVPHCRIYKVSFPYKKDLIKCKHCIDYDPDPEWVIIRHEHKKKEKLNDKNKCTWHIPKTS